MSLAQLTYFSLRVHVNARGLKSAGVKFHAASNAIVERNAVKISLRSHKRIPCWAQVNPSRVNEISVLAHKLLTRALGTCSPVALKNILCFQTPFPKSSISAVVAELALSAFGTSSNKFSCVRCVTFSSYGAHAENRSRHLRMCTCGATQRVRTWLPRGKCAQHLQTCRKNWSAMEENVCICARVVSNGATELWPLQTTSAINNHPAECHAWICVYARRGVSALACSHLSYITMLSFGARQAVYAPRADLIYGFCRVCVLYRCPISIYTPVHVCLKLG